MPALLALEARLQSRADVRDPPELAIRVVKIGGRVWGKDVGQQAEVVRIDGDAERIERALDVHYGKALGETERLRARKGQKEKDDTTGRKSVVHRAIGNSVTCCVSLYRKAASLLMQFDR